MPGKTWTERGTWKSTNALIVRRMSGGPSHRLYFEIFPTGNPEDMPLIVDSVKLQNESMTIFDVAGNLFCGKGKEFEIKIWELPNKVITAEITVKEVVQK